MGRRAATSYSGTRYQTLRQDDDAFIDAQFKAPPKTVPWRTIMYALVLCVFGTILLVVGSLLVSGHIDEKYGDRTWPLIILGLLMFIPGSYHTFVAYSAFKGCVGYSFDDIPAYDVHDN